MKMQRIMTGLAFFVLASVATFAQAAKPAAPQAGPPTTGRVLNNSLRSAEREFVSAAEAMPDEKFNFAPTNGDFKGVRTFAQQVKHVAAANYMFYAALAGEKPPVDLGTGENGPDNLKSKGEIVAFLKGSFDYGHKVLSATAEDKWISTVKSPFGSGTTTPLGLAVLTHGHIFDHYGQIVEYLRMNDIIPPASRPRGQ